MAKTVSPAPSREALRHRPTQRRSRERVERILAVTTALLEAGGSDALRMSEVAQQAEVSIGSLYQYFPDKTALIAELAERYNAEGRSCVEAAFAEVRRRDEVVPALHYVIDSYYEMFVRYPALRDIWGATQADKTLQKLDEADIAAHAAILSRTLRTLYPQQPEKIVEDEALLLMHLIAAAVRLALSVEPGRAVIILGKLKGMIAFSSAPE